MRKIQEGQWLCQALKFHSSEFLMTEPAVVQVIRPQDAHTWTPAPPTPSSLPAGGADDGLAGGTTNEPRQGKTSEVRKEYSI